MQKFRLFAIGGTLAALGGIGFIVPASAPPADAAAVDSPDVLTRPGLAGVAGTAGAADSVIDALPGLAELAELLEAAPSSDSAAAAPVEAPRTRRVLDTFSGSASYYADKFEGRTTASGVPFRQARMWAAHKTLPFGTKLRVTNLANGNQVEVEVVDRGPYAHGRVLDLSRSAARALDFIRSGHTRVRIEVMAPPPGSPSLP